MGLGDWTFDHPNLCLFCWYFCFSPLSLLENRRGNADPKPAPSAWHYGHPYLLLTLGVSVFTTAGRWYFRCVGLLDVKLFMVLLLGAIGWLYDAAAGSSSFIA